MATGDNWQVNHDVIKVYDCLRYHASRATGVDRFNGGKSGGIGYYRSAYSRLQSIWGKRLFTLRDGGWAAVQSGKQLTYMQNCPPRDVMTCSSFDSCRLCDRSYICPFCYATRRTLIPFKRMEVAIYGKNADRTEAKPIRDDLRVVAFCAKIKGRSVAAWPEEVPERGQMVDMQEKMIARRRKEVDGWDPDYGTVAFQVRPDTAHRRLVAYRQGVLLMRRSPTAEALESFRKGSGPIDVFPATKVGLVEAFRLAMGYDTAIMDEPAKPLAAVLHAFHGFKYQSWVGQPVDVESVFPTGTPPPKPPKIKLSRRNGGFNLDVRY